MPLSPGWLYSGMASGNDNKNCGDQMDDPLMTLTMVISPPVDYHIWVDQDDVYTGEQWILSAGDHLLDHP